MEVYEKYEEGVVAAQRSAPVQNLASNPVNIYTSGSILTLVSPPNITYQL